jgi:hypothetical protein
MKTSEENAPSAPSALGETEALIVSLASDPLRAETPSALVDEELRAAGGDPARIRSEGAALAATLLARRRAVIADRAREDLARRRQAAASAPRIPRDSRDELLRMLTAVQQSPRYAGQVTAMFRKRKLDDATNEELAVLLEEIEAARRADEGGDGDEGADGADGDGSA